MTFAYTKATGTAADTTPTLWPTDLWTWPDGPGGGVPPWPDDHDFDAIVAADGPWPPGWHQVQVVQVAVASIEVVAPAPTVVLPNDPATGCAGTTFALRGTSPNTGLGAYGPVDFTVAGVSLVYQTGTSNIVAAGFPLDTVYEGDYMGTGNTTSGDPPGWTKTIWLYTLDGSVYKMIWDIDGVGGVNAGGPSTLSSFDCTAGGSYVHADGSVYATAE